MTYFHLKKRILKFFKFFVPFGLWLFLFRSILSCDALIGSESFYIYSVVKYFLDHLVMGTFPLWDPYVAWGAPTQIYFNYVGIFNPLWLLIFVFHSLGLSFYLSFIITMAIYFWLGQWAFYLLARKLLKTPDAAYVAFLLFLFSSVSISLFSQFHVPLIYVPAIWFFYFLVIFLQKPHWHAWLGLTLALGIILSSYLPFYFFTVLGCVGVLVGIFYGNKILGLWDPARKHLAKHQWLLLLFFIVCGLAFLPGYEAYRSTVNKDIVAPFRNQVVDKKSGVDISDYHKVAMNSLAGRMDLKDLYANLDNIRFGDDGFFYVSIFFYIVLLMGMVLKVERKILVLWFSALGIFFLLMTNSFGLHRFLFEHVFYFRLIRNMHFFLPFFLGLVVLLVSMIYDELTLHKKEFLKPRAWFPYLVILGHFLLAGFLFFQDFVILSTFLAVGLSLLYWGLIFWAEGRVDKRIPLFILVLAVLVQPVEVLWRHNQRGLSPSQQQDKDWIRRSVAFGPAHAQWRYQRQIATEQLSNDESARARVTMTDGPFAFNVGFPTFHAYRLTQNIEHEVLIPYAATKFYLYDAALPWNDQSADWVGLRNKIKSESNAVYLSSWQAQKSNSSRVENSPSGKVMKMFSSEPFFKIVDFQANRVRLQTHFTTEKILVYTDSYHPGWKARVNGRAVPIALANAAFKGLRLPAGYNEVEFRFEAPEIKVLWITLQTIFLILVAILMGAVVRDKIQDII